MLKNIGVVDGILNDLRAKRRNMFEERDTKVHKKGTLERELQQVQGESP